MSTFQFETVSSEQADRERAVVAPLGAAVRDLVDATIRTEVDAEEIRTVTAAVEELTARLRQRQRTGGLGVRFTEEGERIAWGNAVVGLRNPIAPPLVIERDGEGGAWAEFTLGAAYEGPPGLVHGGVTALLLDQVLGEAAVSAGRPGMTAHLELRYRRPTPLGTLRAEAELHRTEDHKTWIRGRLLAGGEVTVETEGLFILPRATRERVADGAIRRASGDAG